jgi:hypothetical protein
MGRSVCPFACIIPEITQFGSGGKHKAAEMILFWFVSIKLNGTSCCIWRSNRNLSDFSKVAHRTKPFVPNREYYNIEILSEIYVKQNI